MNDNSQSDSYRPNIDDPILDRHLESLPRFDPFTGFEDRVMSRVLVLPPPWVQSIKRNVRSLIQTRRFRWIAAGLMTTSTISLVAATTFVLSNFSNVSRAVGGTTAAAGPSIWRTVIRFASDSLHEILSLSAPLLGSRNAAWILLAATVGFLVFSALMLFCLMRPECFARSE